MSKGKVKYDILKDAAAVLAKARADNQKWRMDGLFSDIFRVKPLQFRFLDRVYKMPSKQKTITFRRWIPYGQTEDTKL